MTCGNGQVDPGEACDDGNTRSGDGCPADCTEPCGDGVRDPVEACDDGNTVDGDGCSANCRSLDGIFSVSPSMVRFTVTEGDLAPATTVTVRFEYRGDSVLYGYPSDVPQPTWLSITHESSTETGVEFKLQVTDTLSVGERSTTVRFVLSHASTTGLKSFDLQVQYIVEPSDLTAAVAPAALSFATTASGPAPPSQPVSVTFNGANTSLVSAPSWASVTSSSDPAISPASFTISINDTSFAAGTTLSADIVFATSRGALQRRASVHVDYQLRAPPDLTIEATPGALSFTAIADGAVPASQIVNVTFTGASIVAATAPSWVTVVSPPAPVTSPASFVVAVNTTSVAAGTVLSGDLVLATSRAGSQASATVHLDYHVLQVPEVQFVAPYVGVAGRPGVLRVRGRGFQTISPVTIRVGPLDIGPLTPDSDTQITLSYPSLSEGHYPVVVSEPAGTAPLQPELVIVPPLPAVYQAVASAGPRTRLIYDAERRAIYGVNKLGEQIDHVVHADGRWSALPSHVIPTLTDAAMTSNGRLLIALEQDAISELTLSDGLFTRVRRTGNPDPLCGGFFDQALPTNNETIFVVFNVNVMECLGYTPIYLYDTRNFALSPVGSLVNSLAGGSADGTRMYVGHRNLPHPAPVQIFDTLSNSMSESIIDFNLTAVSVSGDASRVILQDTFVYDRSLQITGKVPPRGTTLASRDSTRAFVYVDDAVAPRLEVYDLNGALQAGALYPLLRTVMLPDSANGSGASHAPVAMTSSPDDAIVFVAGDARLLVVPVN